ncbi:MAG: 30S ribosomal protein S6 [Phycisphaerales bacterium]
MSDIRTHIYEGLFLFPQSASADVQAAVDHINEILGRAHAEVIALRKWDERRLAYDIHGNKRGVYFLAYFKARTDSLAGIERDCRLSEKLLRTLITKADHVPPTDIAASDGRQQLADEAKLRGSAATSEATATADA